MILEMASSAGDRPAVTAGGRALTAAQILRLAQGAAGRFRRYPAVLYLGTNHLAYPVALFGAALAGCRSFRSTTGSAGPSSTGLWGAIPGPWCSAKTISTDCWAQPARPLRRA